jgi:DNA-binding transcriptional LysR family regulator
MDTRRSVIGEFDRLGTLRPVDLRELESFVAVAEELHFGRAARRAHISQPALSQQIQRLERELGFALFSRDRRHVELTVAGTVLLARVRRLLDDADDMVATAGRVAAGRAGTLRIGHVGGALYGGVPSVVRRLHELAPEVDVVLEEHKTARQLELIREGRLDAGFIHLPSEPLDGFDVTVIDREPLDICLPAGHRLAGAEGVRLGDLAGDPFVLFARPLEPDTYDGIMAACRTEGFEPCVVQEATHLQGLISLVAAGLGVGFSVRSVAVGLHRAGVVFRPIVPVAVELTNAVVWRVGYHNPALTCLQSALDPVDID